VVGLIVTQWDGFHEDCYLTMKLSITVVYQSYLHNCQTKHFHSSVVPAMCIQSILVHMCIYTIKSAHIKLY